MRETTCDRSNSGGGPIGFSCHPPSRSIVMNKLTGVTNLKYQSIRSTQFHRVLLPLPLSQRQWWIDHQRRMGQDMRGSGRGQEELSSMICHFSPKLVDTLLRCLSLGCAEFFRKLSNYGQMVVFFCHRPPEIFGHGILTECEGQLYKQLPAIIVQDAMRRSSSHWRYHPSPGDWLHLPAAPVHLVINNCLAF